NFYYLKTRYYDPTTGRFISADNIETAVTAQQFLPNGLNLYLYCFNDPINAKDENGDMPEWLKNTLFIAAAVVVVAALVVGAVVTDVTLFVALTVVTFGTTGIVAGIAGGALMGD
ncbi:MAG: hypothetical protein FWD76_06110, partial [Firmicutes bacterium]|nr:hypothetical protein [Bacillota bacterium]